MGPGFRRDDGRRKLAELRQSTAENPADPARIGGETGIVGQAGETASRFPDHEAPEAAQTKSINTPTPVIPAKA